MNNRNDRNLNTLVSIILVNWNGKKWLEKCISSIREQTYMSIEIIFVDNASTDESLSYVAGLKLKNLRIIKNTENVGFGSGNWAGIKKAEGSLILLLNTDTWVDKDFVKSMVHEYTNSRADIVAPTLAKYDGTKNETYITTIDPFGYQIFLKPNETNIKDDFYLNGACLLFSRQLFLETDGFDEDFFMYCEEVDWMWRLRLYGFTQKRFNDIFVYHAVGGSTEGTGLRYRVFLWRNQNTLQMLIKNYHWQTLTWVLPLYIAQNIVEACFFFILLKPKISFSYFQGWWFNVKHLRHTLIKRRAVQQRRIIKDRPILDQMYYGSAKAIEVLKRKNARE